MSAGRDEGGRTLLWMCFKNNNDDFIFVFQYKSPSSLPQSPLSPRDAPADAPGGTAGIFAGIPSRPGDLVTDC
jgi:hypothetical protein